MIRRAEMTEVAHAKHSSIQAALGTCKDGFQQRKYELAWIWQSNKLGQLMRHGPWVAAHLWKEKK
jgi:hypothetical protein